MDFYPANCSLVEHPGPPAQPWSPDSIVGTANTDSTCQCWGYTMARAWSPDGLHWVAAGWIGGGGFSGIPSLEVFGRARDHFAWGRWFNT